VVGAGYADTVAEEVTGFEEDSSPDDKLVTTVGEAEDIDVLEVETDESATEEVVDTKMILPDVDVEVANGGSVDVVTAEVPMKLV